MVLVRKSELACRDGWDHDLWEPRESGGPSNRPSSQRVSTTHSGETNGAAVPTRPRVARNGVGVGPGEHAVPVTPGGREIGTQENGGSDGVDELKEETIVFHSVRSREQRPEPAQPEPSDPAPARAEASAAVLERHSPVRVVWPERPEHTTTQEQPEADPPEVNPEEAQSRSPRVQQSGATEQFEVEPVNNASFGVAEADAATDVDETPEVEDASESYDSGQLPMLQTGNACCRNCRDFIPAKNGQGGFCDNPFAFDQRQQVSGDTVACQGSFGSWWSPSDDWWMERADIAHHSAPTPLVNHLIRQIRSRYLEEEGSTEGQQRS